MSHSKLLTVFIFLFFVFSDIYAQDRTIDSLKRVLQNPKMHDTTKLLNIGALLDQTPTENERSRILNNMMGEMAAKNLAKTNQKELHKSYTKYLAAYYSNMAEQYKLKRDVVNAISSVDKSISLFRSVGAYDEMNFVIINKGVFYYQINDIKKSIQCLFTALKYFEKNPDVNREEITYVESTIATIYANQKMHEKAIAYFRKTIDYFNSKKKLEGQNEYQLNEALMNCGTSYLAIKKYDEAISYFTKALAYFRKTRNGIYISVSLGKIAQVRMEQGKFQEAEYLLNDALKSDTTDIATANTYINLGDLFYRKKDFTRSEFYLSEGFSLSKKVKNLQLQEKAAELLLKVSKENRNFEKALEVYEFQAKLNDSSDIESSKNVLAQQQLTYNFEKKQLNLELDAEKKAAIKNNWLIALSGALLLVLLGGYFYYRNNRQKQEIAVLEKDRIKQKLLLSQMNPHFIFNSIDNIQSLIINQKESIAISYLDSFSKLTRQILEHSNENYISLEEEIDMIKNYLAIQQLLYDNKFDFTIKIENITDTESYFIPPMLAQPFIENAIKHGIRNTMEKGLIEIIFYLNREKLFFEIKDNGVGFSHEKKESGHKSMAMKITKERLLNYTRNKDFEIILENKLDAENNVKGAKIIFEIPYICEN